MPFHLPQKQCDRKDCRGGGISHDPRKIRPYIRKAAGASSLLHPYGMAERQQLGGCFERSANEFKIKPYARQPCCEVCQQRPAYAADGISGDWGK